VSGDFKTESFRGRHVYDEIEIGRLLDWEIGRFRPTENFADVVSGAPEHVPEVL
jgi:hypothetical protein